MTFSSILFRQVTDRPPEERPAVPDVFVDLNLDQIVASVVGGSEEYDLAPFFHMPLRDLDAIAFRHEVMRDIEQPRLLASLRAFARGMRAVRDHLAQAGKLHQPLQQQRWFLDAVDFYGEAATRLLEDLSSTELRSRGFTEFRAFLREYIGSSGYRSRVEQTAALKRALEGITYCTLLEGPRVDVRLFEGEPDYSTEVLATFERFRQGDAQGYTFDFSERAEVNHIEAQILDRVALLYPDVFRELASFATINEDFQDPTLRLFDREVQFYIAYLDYIAALKKAGLRFCYPSMTEERGEIFDRDAFDLALAAQFAEGGETPVCNDFHLSGPERVIVVSGPNQGGKTTFARMFGQLHYLAALGCPIPGSRARLTLIDKLFTHFERSEDIADLRGKLQDDLVRVRRILEEATPHSVIVMNEIFASTTLRDAIVLGRKIADRILRLDLYCVWVTFIDELAGLGKKTVSMTSMVVAEQPAERTYKILRRPADGRAYAMSIAEKYRLTDAMIRERIPS